MIIQIGEIIYNKIKQGLINIPGDFVIEKHVRLRIPEKIISSSEFIMTHKAQGPMKMQERRVM